MRKGQHPESMKNMSMTIAYAKFTIFAQDKDWDNAEESLKVIQLVTCITKNVHHSWNIKLHALGTSDSCSVRPGD